MSKVHGWLGGCLATVWFDSGSNTKLFPVTIQSQNSMMQSRFVKLSERSLCKLSIPKRD